MADPLVSIVCNTYNHEPFIRQTLEGFLMQQTDFPFEVLVHDDASTDHTASIIREIAEQHSDIIKPIFQTENQYSKGVFIGKLYQFPRAKGRYIAMCEGDDFWTDPLKLQKQVDAMEIHPETAMCSHSTTRLYRQGEEKLISFGDQMTIITPEQIIAGGGLSLNTCSLLFRTSMLDTHWRFREFYPFDYTLKVQGALQGGILYLPENMATYRFQSTPDAWTTRARINNEEKIAHFQKRIQMLDYLNEDTAFQYNSVIQETKKSNEFEVHWGNADFRALVRPEYSKYLKKKPIRKQMLIRFGCLCPPLALKLRDLIYHFRLKHNDLS